MPDAPHTPVSAMPADTFSSRLRAACQNAVSQAQFGRYDLVVGLTLTIDGACPPDHQEAILRAIPELVGNAVAHGFYERPNGHVDVWLTCRNHSETRLDVVDDGWGFEVALVADGRGFRLLRSFGQLSQDTRATQTGRRTTTVSLLIGTP